MKNMSMTINVHHPAVAQVKLYEEDGLWFIYLGQEKYSNTVALFVSDAEWDAIVARVAAERERITDAPTADDVITSGVRG